MHGTLRFLYFSHLTLFYISFAVVFGLLVLVFVLEISTSGFELVRKSVMFRVFPAVFARLLVIQQLRGNGRRLVHKMTNNGFEMLEKARFIF